MLGFPSSQDRISPEVTAAYLEALANVSVEAVERACGQFLAGKVPDHNSAFLPSAPQLAANARGWDEAIASITATRKLAKLTSYPIGKAPPPPLLPLGPTKLEIEGVITDVSDWSHEEKEAAITSGKRPPSRNSIGDGSRRIAIPVKRM